MSATRAQKAASRARLRLLATPAERASRLARARALDAARKRTGGACRWCGPVPAGRAWATSDVCARCDRAVRRRPCWLCGGPTTARDGCLACTGLLVWDLEVRIREAAREGRREPRCASCGAETWCLAERHCSRRCRTAERLGVEVTDLPEYRERARFRGAHGAHGKHGKARRA